MFLWDFQSICFLEHLCVAVFNAWGVFETLGKIYIYGTLFENSERILDFY